MSEETPGQIAPEFDAAKAVNAKLFRAERRVLIRAEWLADSFEEGTKPEERFFVVGNPGADGLARANDAEERSRNRDSVFAALEVAGVVEKGSKLAEALQINKTGDTPADIARRVELFLQSVIYPTPSLQLAVKMKDHAPTDFWAITSAAISLAGEGDKKKPSGITFPGRKSASR